MTGTPTLRDLKRDVKQLAENDPTSAFETSITRMLVLERDRAKREGREILGVADTRADVEHVYVSTKENLP